MKKNAKNQKRKQEEDIKKQKVLKTQSTDKLVDEAAELPIKRPRGRPRKNVVAPPPPIIT